MGLGSSRAAETVRSLRGLTRRRRYGPFAAVALAAVVLGGTAGVLLGFAAALLLIDAVLPMPGQTWSEADDRFRRLERRRRLASRARRMRGLSPERLDVLDDGAGWAATAERRARGIELIQVGSITGTVEELKAGTFDRAFRPDRSSRRRWEALWVAQAHGVTLPPISVYRVGTDHILRDGHHRVSVALDRGSIVIEADVVELRRKSPGLRTDPGSWTAAPGGR